MWPGNGNDYKVFKEPLSWHDAKKRCEDLGGRLVVITSAEEQAFVWDVMQRSQAAGWDDFLWAGATDDQQHGTWKWVDGDRMTYTAWSSGQPDNYQGVGHYLNLMGRDHGKWNDASATDSLSCGFVCEWDRVNRKFERYRLVATNSSLNGFEAYYRTIEFFDADSGKIITGGKASGTGLVATNAFDDDLKTVYRTIMNPGVERDSVTYELPQPAAINRIRVIQLGPETNHVFQLEVQGCNDDANWIPVMKAKGVPAEFDSADPSAQVEWLTP